jgi:hypothetical protein
LHLLGLPRALVQFAGGIGVVLVRQYQHSAFLTFRKFVHRVYILSRVAASVVQFWWRCDNYRQTIAGAPVLLSPGLGGLKKEAGALCF